MSLLVLFSRIIPCTIVFSILLSIPVLADEHEKKLQEDLIRGYNRLVRPVEKNSDQMVVKLGIKLIQILDVDEKNQILTTNVWLKHIWKDKYLMWDPLKYGNLTKISIPSSEIWVPDIIIYNSADGKYEIRLMTRAKIDYLGNVVWEPPAIYKSSCTINVEFFPFDEQHCAMKFGSWTYDGQQVDLVHIKQTTEGHLNGHVEPEEDYIEIGMDLQDYYQSHEWNIMSVPAKRSVVYSTISHEFYPDITFNITLRRKTLFYTCNLIIPCVGLSFLTLLTFYLPSESGEKISLCISILLALTVFVLLLNDLIPPTSLVVPLIGKYLSFTFFLVTISNLCAVVVLNIHFRSPNTHQMPVWTKTLFLYVLPKILLMKRPPISSKISASNYLKVFANSVIMSTGGATVSSGNCLVESSSTNTNNTGPNRRKDSIYFSNLDKRLETFNLIENITGVRTNMHQKSPPITFNNSKKSPSRSNSNTSINDSKRLVYSEREHGYHADKMEAINALCNIVRHLKEEDEENRIKQEWRYTALVIDRLLLVIFSTSCIIGTLTIILQAPSFYDNKTPIDQIMSKKF